MKYLILMLMVSSMVACKSGGSNKDNKPENKASSSYEENCTYNDTPVDCDEFYGDAKRPGSGLDPADLPADAERTCNYNGKPINCKEFDALVAPKPKPKAELLITSEASVSINLTKNKIDLLDSDFEIKEGNYDGKPYSCEASLNAGNDASYTIAGDKMFLVDLMTGEKVTFIRRKDVEGAGSIGAWSLKNEKEQKITTLTITNSSLKMTVECLITKN